MRELIPMIFNQLDVNWKAIMRGPHKVHKFASAGIISIFTEKCSYRKRSSDRNCLFILIFLFRCSFWQCKFRVSTFHWNCGCCDHIRQYIIESIESSFGHNKVVDKMTINARQMVVKSNGNNPKHWRSKNSHVNRCRSRSFEAILIDWRFIFIDSILLFSVFLYFYLLVLYFGTIPSDWVIGIPMMSQPTQTL